MTNETRIDDPGLPTLPGVYVIREGRLGHDEQVQLDETGQWWPYPYMFSGWREGELRVMGGTWYRLDDVVSDVPEIRNPAVAESIDYFANQLTAAFPEIDAARVSAFARDYILRDRGYITDDEED